MVKKFNFFTNYIARFINKDKGKGKIKQSKVKQSKAKQSKVK